MKPGQEESARSFNPFGKFANMVDGFFAKYFYKIGFFVGSRPCASIGLTMLFVLLCMGGFSQLHAEGRGDKLWIPQGTVAQDDQASFNAIFPSKNRPNMVLLESKTGNVLTKKGLTAAMKLFEDLASTKAGEDTMETLCIQKPGDGHPCFIMSILMMWDFKASTLAADADPLATINAAGKTPEDLNRMLGGTTFSGSKITGAKALTVNFMMQSNEEPKPPWRDPRGRAWEEVFLKKIVCDAPTCDDGMCSCGYVDGEIAVYANAARSRRDVFGTAIRGDVGLINAAFAIMIIYLTLNLGGLCHKIKSRALLALGCVLSIVLAGAAGYGLAMWFQFDYTPVMSVLPFVLLGIGVDDSFVIMNSLDRTDPALPVPERIAQTLAHAGVSIMITSMTDFVAFAISASSALPALAAFCFYAAMTVVMLFVLQVTVFTAFATFDTRRVNAGLIDCCPCICKKGCPCCPIILGVAPDDGKDPNQLCVAVCAQSSHKGGKMGKLLEVYIAPNLVKLPVAAAVIAVSIGFAALCAWRASLLAVEDAAIKFVPDDSYVYSYSKKNDLYFGTLGQAVSVVTESGDYFASQAALTSMGDRMDALGYMQSSKKDSFENWAAAYSVALKGGAATVGATVATDANGIATNKAQYYSGLKTWLSGQGGQYAKDVVWVDKADPQKGIRAARIHAEYTPFNTVVDERLIINTGKAVEVMDGLRDAVGSWKDMPGKSFAYNYMFLSWEVFRVIKKEMFMNVGLCLIAVFVISVIFLAHPGIAILVVTCVIMTIVEVLGCMEMWGLAIDNVSVIQLVISVGLAVDYSAHIGHSFMTKSGTRAERVVATLGDVGSAVLNGGFSTFLAVMLLSVSKSYVFRVLFQTFFLTVVLGLGHGMIVLPAFLCLIGPEGYAGRAVMNQDLENKVSPKEVDVVEVRVATPPPAEEPAADEVKA